MYNIILILKYNTPRLFRFLVAKFNLNLVFVQFILTNSKNLYRLHFILKHKIYIVFRKDTRACSYKNATILL